MKDIQWWWRDVSALWMQSFPCETKHQSQETVQNPLQRFVLPDEKSVVSANSSRHIFPRAFGPRANFMVQNMLVLVHFVSQQHSSSTPDLSKDKGIAQRAFRRVKEGTSAVLLHTGSDELWWADARAFSCCSRNVQDLLADGKTPYYRSFGELFDGPNVTFLGEF